LECRHCGIKVSEMDGGICDNCLTNINKKLFRVNANIDEQEDNNNKNSSNGINSNNQAIDKNNEWEEIAKIFTEAIEKKGLSKEQLQEIIDTLYD